MLGTSRANGEQDSHVLQLHEVEIVTITLDCEMVLLHAVVLIECYLSFAFMII